MASANPVRRKVDRPDLVAAVLCLGFVALAWLAAQAHPIGSYGVETDFYQVYASNTAVLLSGEPYTYVAKPFGFMIVLAGVKLLVGDFFFWPAS